MITPESLEQFRDKWDSEIQSALKEIQKSILAAGYEVSYFEEEAGYIDSDPPLLRWFMYTGIRNRPDDDADRDIMVSFDIIGNEPEDGLLTPVLEASTGDGSIVDDIKLSHPLLPESPEWSSVWEALRERATDVTRVVQSWNPKPVKRVWRIGGLGPGSRKTHPSIHTNEEIARSEITERLGTILERATALLFDLDAKKQRKGWDASTSTALMNARLTLHNGKPLRALRMYHRLLEDLNPEMLDLINSFAGTLDVEAEGTYIEELVD